MAEIVTDRGSFWVASHRKADDPRPTLLILHGVGGSHLSWPGEVRRINTFGVVVPDLAGHGKSTSPMRRTIAEYAEDMIAVMDTMGIADAFIAGYSMGGGIALQMALDHPSRVRGLILICTGAKLGVSAELRKQLVDDPAGARETLIDLWFTGATDPDWVAATRKILAATPDQALIDGFEACNVFDIRQRIGEIHVPTLIITADQDRLTPPRYGEYLRDHIAGSKLVQIAGSAHHVLAEQPQALGAVIRQWLDEQESS